MNKENIEPSKKIEMLNKRLNELNKRMDISLNLLKGSIPTSGLKTLMSMR
jgi:hypothetical protein